MIISILNNRGKYISAQKQNDWREIAGYHSAMIVLEPRFMFDAGISATADNLASAGEGGDASGGENGDANGDAGNAHGDNAGGENAQNDGGIENFAIRGNVRSA